MRFDRGRALRRSTGLLLATALITAPAVTLASHIFPDVPTNHPFHDEIATVALAGITAGFQDGGFHPADNVTRQAMAAFMHRGFGRIGTFVGGAPLSSHLQVGANVMTSGYDDVRQASINVPGVPNGELAAQYVYASGRVAFRDGMGSLKGCPCDFGAFIRNVDTMTDSVWMYDTLPSDTNTSMYYSLTVDGLFVEEPGTTANYVLYVFLNSRANVAPAVSFALDESSSLTVMSFPFSNEGGIF